MNPANIEIVELYAIIDERFCCMLENDITSLLPKIKSPTTLKDGRTVISVELLKTFLKNPGDNSSDTQIYQGVMDKIYDILIHKTWNIRLGTIVVVKTKKRLSLKYCCENSSV